MSLNLWSDPVLRARQEQLNSQWYALNDTVDSCELTASSSAAFSQFYSDYDAWKTFFDSGSDWSSDSKHTTDIYQTKLQEYTKTIKGYCSGGAQPYIPGVKDPPKDTPGLLDRGIDLAKAPFDLVDSVVTKVGIITGVLVFAVLATIIYVAVKGNVSAAGVSLGRR